jgi:hypothetical protein
LYDIASLNWISLEFHWLVGGLSFWELMAC